MKIIKKMTAGIKIFLLNKRKHVKKQIAKRRAANKRKNANRKLNIK